MIKRQNNTEADAVGSEWRVIERTLNELNSALGMAIAERPALGLITLVQ